jgi:hypothetical protein
MGFRFTDICVLYSYFLVLHCTVRIGSMSEREVYMYCTAQDYSESRGCVYCCTVYRKIPPLKILNISSSNLRKIILYLENRTREDSPSV